MTTETMTVHKALAELKILDNRILNTIINNKFCVANQHSNTKINGIEAKEYEKVMQGAYDKTTDLIKRRKAIKKAVTLSNAITKVKIGNEEYTVAEAIEMKNHGIEFEEELLSELRKQYALAQRIISEKNGETLEKRAENYVIGIYGSKEGKTNSDEYEKVKQDFINSQTYELIDPIGIVDEIKELEEYISNFKVEFDAALSVSNAITELTIEY